MNDLFCLKKNQEEQCNLYRKLLLPKNIRSTFLRYQNCLGACINSIHESLLRKNTNVFRFFFFLFNIIILLVRTFSSEITFKISSYILRNDQVMHFNTVDEISLAYWEIFPTLSPVEDLVPFSERLRRNDGFLMNHPALKRSRLNPCAFPDEIHEFVEVMKEKSSPCLRFSLLFILYYDLRLRETSL